jgi:hypothetical protein
MRRTFLRAATAGLLTTLALTGCAELAAVRGDIVDVDVSYLEIAPGLRHFVAWPIAHEQCAARGLEPKLVGIDENIVHYRCIRPE